jgi:hypothetical protein
LQAGPQRIFAEFRMPAKHQQTQSAEF